MSLFSSNCAVLWMPALTQKTEEKCGMEEYNDGQIDRWFNGIVLNVFEINMVKYKFNCHKMQAPIMQMYMQEYKIQYNPFND